MRPPCSLRSDLQGLRRAWHPWAPTGTQGRVLPPPPLAALPQDLTCRGHLCEEAGPRLPGHQARVISYR